MASRAKSCGRVATAAFRGVARREPRICSSNTWLEQDASRCPAQCVAPPAVPAGASDAHRPPMAPRGERFESCQRHLEGRQLLLDSCHGHSSHGPQGADSNVFSGSRHGPARDQPLQPRRPVTQSPCDASIASSRHAAGHDPAAASASIHKAVTATNINRAVVAASSNKAVTVARACRQSGEGKNAFSRVRPSTRGVHSRYGGEIQWPPFGKSYRAAVKVGSDEMSFETGKLARLADGAVLVRHGNTQLLATAVSMEELMLEEETLPLQVEYREFLFSSGRIPSTPGRREGAPKDQEVLISRVMDRAVRPLFPEGFLYDTQIVGTLLSLDPRYDPDVAAINAASAALTVSDIPWNGPVGAVKVARVSGQLVVNPSQQQLTASDLQLLYAGTVTDAVMIEAAARSVPDGVMAEAMRLAHAHCVRLLEPQRQLAEQLRRRKREVEFFVVPPAVMQRTRQLAEGPIDEVLRDAAHSKHSRAAAFKAIAIKAKEAAAAEDPELDPAYVTAALTRLEYEVMRRNVLERDWRADGRHLDAIRPLHMEVGSLPFIHGSSTFTRGDTQSQCAITLGSTLDSQKLDDPSGVTTNKQFMLHYTFPPFSVNETGKLGGIGRREIGHGMLAEKALLAVMPTPEEFPYTVRVNSNIMASDGSSSMASVCSGSLALMDAGVPIRSHVAGISVGLVTALHQETKGIAKYKLLMDIVALEDHLGDMDFKVAGTADGVTAIQLDCKLPGVPLDILFAAMELAKQGRLRLLDAMGRVILGPNVELKDSAPVFERVVINKEMIGRLVGPGGLHLRQLEKETGAKVNLNEDGYVDIFCPAASIMLAKRRVEELAGKEIETGGVYRVTVFAIKPYGAFVEFPSGRQGLIHISELDHGRVTRVEDVVREGEELLVECLGQDERGSLNLSRKSLLPPPSTSSSPPGTSTGLPLPDRRGDSAGGSITSSSSGGGKGGSSSSSNGGQAKVTASSSKGGSAKSRTDGSSKLTGGGGLVAGGEPHSGHARVSSSDTRSSLTETEGGVGLGLGSADGGGASTNDGDSLGKGNGGKEMAVDGLAGLDQSFVIEGGKLEEEEGEKLARGRKTAHRRAAPVSSVADDGDDGDDDGEEDEIGSARIHPPVKPVKEGKP